MTKVRTRFAPSPTGKLHIGGLRTALYAYALAKHNGGEFILRIEDTDKKREVEAGKEMIIKTLKSFGLNWDGDLFVQSERVKTGIYKEAADRLVKQGNAYEEDGAIRLKLPENEKVSFHDFVLGKDVEWDSSTLANLVLLKSDGFPTYHLAVVVDDNDMGITHVLRGHDWLPSTPIHILIYKYLGYEMPEIGHLTDILDPEGGKLSKRKGSTSVEGLLAEGYLPEAILNFVMLLGWAPKDNRELFTLKEFVDNFDPKGFQKSNPVFDKNKLDWFNGQYIRNLSSEEFLKRVKDFVPEDWNKDLVEKITPLVKERIKKLSEFSLYAEAFFKTPEVKVDLLKEGHKEHLETTLKAFEKIETWDRENIDQALVKIPEENKFHRGDYFMNLRVSQFSSAATVPINDSFPILGKDEVLKRIKNYLK